MRSMWKGAISFGLVNIPVRMYSATTKKSVSFNQLHSECYTPIRYEKKCPTCDKEVSQAEIRRGFEYEPGRYVVIDDAELESLPVPTTKTIEIVDFISLSEVDPIYYDKSYYLEPTEGAQKPYVLLRRAMLDSKKVAVAKFAVRARESLCALRVFENALSLVSMHYPDEIRSVQQLEGIGREPGVSEVELKMAVQLIENLASPFDPAKYTDEYRTALLELIQQKATGQQVHEAPVATPATGKVVDLMAALEASLKATRDDKKKAKEPRKKELVTSNGRKSS